MYTAQEIVNKVWDRLNDGTGRAGQDFSHDSFICQYLSTTGNKCAVGIFIPEGHPGQKNVGDVEDLLSEFSEDPTINWMQPFEKLLTDMQSIHDEKTHWNDDNSFSARGARRFEDACQRHSLEFPG